MLIKLREDILLNPFSSSDIDELIEMLKNPSVNKYIFFAPAPEEKYRSRFTPMVERFQEALKNNTLPEDLIFSIKTSKDEFVGEVGIYANPEVEGVYEVAYQIKEEYWERGIGTLVCSFATNFIFETLKGHRAEASCYADNIGSRRVLERCGYSLEGELINYFKTPEGAFNKVIYGRVK